MEAYSVDAVLLVVISFLVSFVLACGIGANDVANSFGTSVGSKVLSVRSACILATIFEMAGAVLIGYKVSDTMRKGILDVTLYENNELELILGCLSSLVPFFFYWANHISSNMAQYSMEEYVDMIFIHGFANGNESQAAREYALRYPNRRAPDLTPMDFYFWVGSAIWLIVATFLKLPISGTHSIVGATVGFSLVCRGTQGLHFKTLAMIVASWFVSPLLSGIVSVVLFVAIRGLILRAQNPLTPALRALPFFYMATIAVNVFSIVHSGPKLLHLDNIPLWIALVVSIGIGVLAAICVQLFVVPWQRKQVLDDIRKSAEKDIVQFTFGDSTDSSRDASPRNSKMLEEAKTLPVIVEVPANNNGYILAESESLSDIPIKECKTDIEGPRLNPHVSVTPAFGLSPNSSAVPLIKEKPIEPMQIEVKGDEEVSERPEIIRVFSFLQILTATFGSFAHGGNDVSNAIGPLVAVWLIFTDGNVLQKSETPLFILIFGGIGIAIGLWVWGRRVIQTIGEDLTKITPTTGFSIEIGAAMTVLLASKIGIPISTTHCKVGSVVFVGWAGSSSSGVDWRLFRNIISAWIVTVPVAGILSAAFTFALRPFVI